MSPTIFFAVFFATMVIDSFYALYMIKVTAKAPFLAASYGSLIHILTAFTVISYTKNYLYLIPLVIGSFIGTYLTVKLTGLLSDFLLIKKWVIREANHPFVIFLS